MKQYVTLIVCVAVAVCVGTVWATIQPAFAWPRAGEHVKAVVVDHTRPHAVSYDLCFSRHAATRCYGGHGRAWRRIVVDGMKGFR